MLREATDLVYKQLKEDWVPPKVASIHWDGKLMETQDGKGNVERLPILVSGIGGIKLLGVPALPFKSTEKAGALILEAEL